jgi:hyperosmotically inducible periplasmic protein
MKKLVLLSVVAVAAAYLPAVQADQYGSDTDRSQPRTFVKDSVITTKVKSKLAAKHMSTLTNIKVDTDANGAVWLSGKAPTKDAKDLAAMVAKDTDGVTSVHNDIVVEP